MHAIDFSIDIENTIDGQFNVEIMTSEPEQINYDVKIFFRRGSEVLDSEIQYEGSWNNAYYYLKSAFPESKKYSVRLAESKEHNDLELCVRLRQEGKNAFTEQCKGTSPENSSVKEQEPISNTNTIKADSEPIVLRNNIDSSYSFEGKTRIFINYLLAFVALMALFLIVGRKHREL